MSGFVLIKGKLDNNIVNHQSSKYLVENLEYNDLFIQRRTIKKFLDDKVFKQNDEYLIVTEGVIFNKLDLIKKYKKDNFFETIIEMYKKNGETFFNEFRGSFSGIFIDKKNNKQLIFTDHIGTKPIFYNNNNNIIIISSDITWITDVLKNNKKSYSFDQIGAYCLLTYGFMIDEMTLIKEIKRLLAGNYIVLENGKENIKEYFKLKNTPNKEETDEEIIENIDMLFKQAIERQVNKNYEYGYEDLAPLSAGLDSRMTVFALTKNKKVNNLLTFTYSESNYFDEKIPKQIADDLGINWLFKSLDNGLNLFLLEETIKINNGLCLFGGGAQVLDMFQNINIDKKGIIHTGMIGDVVVGTFYEKIKNNNIYQIGEGAYSKKLIKKIEKIEIKKYDNQEIFKFYTRGFLGANMGSPIIFQDSLESFSPFYDLEFISYCLTIPVEKRFGHCIYDKWILSKYPEASKYLHNGKRKIGDKTIEILGRNISRREVFNKILKFILRKLKIIKNDLETRHHMNPVDYWYNTNDKLKLYFDNYYEENLKLLKKDVELKENIEFLYKTGTSIEKTQVLSLLAAIKLYFDEV